MGDNLPELPKPFGYVRDSNGGPMVFQHAPFDETTRLLCSTETVYTPAQLRAFAEEAVRQEREACAKRLTEDEIVRLALKENVSSDYAAFRAGVRSAERALLG